MFRFCFLLVVVASAFTWAKIDNAKLTNSLKRIEESRTQKGSYQVEVLGYQYWANHNVFSPKFFASTAIQNKNFPFKKNETFLDLGSGVGVTTVIAAKSYKNKVVALDINPDAVEMTARNVKLHGVKDLVECRQSDVFSALSTDENFDTIYWDLPYVRSEDDAQLDLLQRAVSDPGYTSISTFFGHVASHMNPKARAIVGFGSLGDRAFLDEIAKTNGYRLVDISSEQHPYRGGISYSLLQLEPITMHDEL